MALDRLIRIRELVGTPQTPGLIPASQATIWRWVKDGNFPQPVKLASRTTVWSASQVQAWIDSKTATQPIPKAH